MHEETSLALIKKHVKVYSCEHNIMKMKLTSDLLVNEIETYQC